MGWAPSHPNVQQRGATQFGLFPFWTYQDDQAAELLVAPFILLKYKHELSHICLRIMVVWACFFPSTREKKIQKLFFSLPDCFPGRFWVGQIWLIPTSLPSDSYTTRTPPMGAISRNSDTHVERWMFVLYLYLSLHSCASESPLLLPSSVQPFPPAPSLRCLMWLFSSALSSCQVILLQKQLLLKQM